MRPRKSSKKFLQKNSKKNPKNSPRIPAKIQKKFQKVPNFEISNFLHRTWRPKTLSGLFFFLFPGHRYASINLNKTANRKWPTEISYMKEENIASTMLQKLSDVIFSIFLLIVESIG